MRLLTLSLILTVSLSALPAQAQWQAILVSGDDSINNFDNSRARIGRLLQERGLTQQQHLTAQFPDLFGTQAHSAHLFGIAQSFTRIPQQADGCVFYISSHGQKNKGVYLKRAQEQTLTPQQLNVALDWYCAQKPTVVLVSACYSGQFIPALKQSNRIIMTAASAQRPSFGCSEDTEYTFWDACVIDNLPQSQTWQQLSDKVKTCISRKEQDLDYPPSLPQVFIGEQVKDLPIRF